MQQIADAFKKFLPLSFSAGRDEDRRAVSQDASSSSVDSNKTHEVSAQGAQPGQRNYVSKNSHPSQKRFRTQIPRIEGFVDVDVTPDGSSLCFHSLLVPGKDREGKLRNRYILLDHYADEWFVDMCWDIVNNKTGMPVRVRVSSIIGENRCYVRPCTRDSKQAMNEWGRLQEEVRGQPISLNECNTSDLVCEYVYRKVAESKNLKIVQWVQEDYTALAVNRSGVIFRMSGANIVEKAVPQIKSGEVNLDDVIEKNVTVFRTYRI